MKVTHEKLLEYMLKTDFQPILVNFWCGNLGGGGGGGRGPPGSFAYVILCYYQGAIMHAPKYARITMMMTTNCMGFRAGKNWPLLFTSTIKLSLLR